MNILVTGANGFIGRALIEMFGKSSHDLFALDLSRSSAAPLKSIKKFYEQDITKEFSVKESFDFVFHLAACNFTHADKASKEAYRQVNVLGTKNVIEAVKTKNFVFLSTTKVYSLTSGVVDEESPVAPQGLYEKSKLEAENICRQYFSGSHLTIFRAVNIVGPGQSEKAVIPIFFKNAYRNKSLNIIGSPDTMVQLLFVQDLLDAFERAIERGGVDDVINLSPDEGVTLKGLAEKIISITGSRSEILSWSSEKAVSVKVDSKKARDVLGWQAKTGINETLEQCHRFYSKIYG